MTKAQVAKLFAFITAVYPQIEIPDGMVEAWLELLEDLDYGLAEAAVKKVLMQREYPTLPTVGEIRKAAAEIIAGPIPAASEAWGEVQEAVKRYGYYREKEALAALSPAVRKVVECIGWQEICACEEPDVIRGQFRRMYETEETREKERAVLPEPLRQLAGETAKKLPEAKPLRTELPPAPEEKAVDVEEIEAMVREINVEDIARRNERLRATIAKMDAYLREKGA